MEPLEEGVGIAPEASRRRGCTDSELVEVESNEPLNGTAGAFAVSPLNRCNVVELEGVVSVEPHVEDEAHVTNALLLNEDAELEVVLNI